MPVFIPTKTRHAIKNLLLRALRIDDAIRREQGKRLPDVFRLLHMKKLRLAISDRLNRALRQRLDSRTHA